MTFPLIFCHDCSGLLLLSPVKTKSKEPWAEKAGPHFGRSEPSSDPTGSPKQQVKVAAHRSRRLSGAKLGETIEKDEYISREAPSKRVSGTVGSKARFQTCLRLDFG